MFQKKFSTIDHIFTLYQIIQKSKEHKIRVKVMFIDYTKTFDSISREYIHGKC